MYQDLTESNLRLRDRAQALRIGGAVPRLHPNGFIQLDFGESVRLHVWPDAPLPMPDPVLPIHDHAYGFESRVLLGMLRHVVYDVRPDAAGDHRLYGVFPWKTHARTSVPAPLDDRLYLVTEALAKTYFARDRYRFEGGLFHQTIVRGFTATLIKTEPYEPSQIARIVCPAHLQPDVAFKREAADLNALWSHIQRASL